MLAIFFVLKSVLSYTNRTTLTSFDWYICCESPFIFDCAECLFSLAVENGGCPSQRRALWSRAPGHAGSGDQGAWAQHGPSSGTRA